MNIAQTREALRELGFNGPALDHIHSVVWCAMGAGWTYGEALVNACKDEGIVL